MCFFIYFSHTWPKPIDMLEKLRQGAFRCFAPSWLFIHSLQGMCKLYLFLSPLKLINLCWVDSQLQHAEEGIIQSTFVALHGEFSCRYKLFTMLCNSSYIADPWWYSLNLSQTYHTPIGIDSKKWQHIALLWQSNVQIQVASKKENETKETMAVK